VAALVRGGCRQQVPSSAASWGLKATSAADGGGEGKDEDRGVR